MKVMLLNDGGFQGLANENGEGMVSFNSVTFPAEVEAMPVHSDPTLVMVSCDELARIGVTGGIAQNNPSTRDGWSFVKGFEVQVIN